MYTASLGDGIERHENITLVRHSLARQLSKDRWTVASPVTRSGTFFVIGRINEALNPDHVQMTSLGLPSLMAG